MSETALAILRSWPWAPWTVAVLLITAGVYARGWRRLRLRGNRRWRVGHLAAMLGACAALWLAVASPLEPLSHLLLSAHMAQHLLLMLVAPPLVWLSEPLVPLLAGLPRWARRAVAVPLLRSRAVRAAGGWLTRPVVAWLVFVVTIWFWHTPRWFELALARPDVHALEHASFLLAALLFWWPVVLPAPAVVGWPRWHLVPYLLLADVQNTVLCGLLTFSDRVLYEHYARLPRLWGIDPLVDQSAAGVLMWVPGSLALLGPLAVIGWQLLMGPAAERLPLRSMEPIGSIHASRRARVDCPTGAANLLDLPLLGPLLRWPHVRAWLAAPLFALALLIVADGWWGPQVAPLNLAGTLPWIHWRGLVVLALLVLGNVFCLACPFMLPRSLARRWAQPTRRWPARLKNKWLAVALVVLFFWAYESLALWNSPWWTAWIAVGYFLAALAIDASFQGAAFCKYVCPIGQFNFVQSLVSPVEVRTLEPAVCQNCTSHDCLRGNATAAGCELELFQPRKAGNFDCTFCLNCVHACPQQNVGLLLTLPGSALAADEPRATRSAGSGSTWYRRDVAVLALVLVAAALVNAGSMAAPVVEQLEQLAHRAAVSPMVAFTLWYLLGVAVLPAILIGLVTAAGRWAGADPRPWGDLAAGYCLALVPLGAAMWLAHYSFHLLTSWDAWVPAGNRLATAAGLPWQWSLWTECICCHGTPVWLLRWQMLLLDFGLLGSLYAGYSLADVGSRRPGQTLCRLAPWGLLAVALFAAGVWIVFQPMPMRGTLWNGF